MTPVEGDAPAAGEDQHESLADRLEGVDLAEVSHAVEAFLLGESPSLTRVQVAEAAGVPLQLATELWRLLGFPHAEDDEIAFTQGDVTSLMQARDLMRLGVLSSDRQAALVRTMGRSYSRLAEWQASLLADIALERGGEAAEDLLQLAGEVLPRVESLQTQIWRRHLASAAGRLLSSAGAATGSVPQAVAFVDIVGYTARSRRLTERELVDWIEDFEDAMTGLVVDVGGRVIKSLGDAVLYVCDTPLAAARVALAAVARGDDESDPFPRVRAGIAYGDVVLRLGDVFGPTVNIASRLTSVARPGSVVVDEGAGEALAAEESVELKRIRRVSVKGYSRLQAFRLRAADG